MYVSDAEMGSKKWDSMLGTGTTLGLDAVTWLMTWHGMSFGWNLNFFFSKFQIPIKWLNSRFLVFKIPNSNKMVEFQIPLFQNSKFQ
jgi:hypothetical protein